MKFTCYDVQESLFDLDDELINEVDIMSDMSKAKDSFVELDSFKGEAAVTLKNYFSEIHGALVDGFLATCSDIEIKLRLLMDDYYNNVDVKHASVIDTEHIMNLILDLDNIKDDFETSKGVLQGILSDVSDIFTTSENYTLQEGDVLSEIQEIGDEMDKVIKDFTEFNAIHEQDCENVFSILETMEKIICSVQDVFIDTTICYDGNNSEIASLLNDFNADMAGISESLLERQEYWATATLDEVGNVITTYDVAKIAEELGITSADYITMLRQGLKVVYQNDNGQVIMRIVSSTKSTDEIKDFLRGLGLTHLTDSKINKLTGNGLQVIRSTGNVASPSLISELGNVPGFRATSTAVRTNKLDDVVKVTRTSSNFSRVLDGVGYVITAGCDTFDNIYNETTGEFEFTTETISDSVTDTAVDIGLDIGLQKLGMAIGTAIYPGVGTAVGYVAGAVASMLLPVFEFGEPPKSCVDYVKDAVSDVTHGIGKGLSHIFW